MSFGSIHTLRTEKPLCAVLPANRLSLHILLWSSMQAQQGACWYKTIMSQGHTHAGLGTRWHVGRFSTDRSPYAHQSPIYTLHTISCSCVCIKKHFSYARGHAFILNSWSAAILANVLSNVQRKCILSKSHIKVVRIIFYYIGVQSILEESCICQYYSFLCGFNVINIKYILEMMKYFAVWTDRYFKT